MFISTDLDERQPAVSLRRGVAPYVPGRCRSPRTSSAGTHQVQKRVTTFTRIDLKLKHAKLLVAIDAEEKLHKGHFLLQQTFNFIRTSKSVWDTSRGFRYPASADFGTDIYQVLEVGKNERIWVKLIVLIVLRMFSSIPSGFEKDLDNVPNLSLASAGKNIYI